MRKKQQPSLVFALLSIVLISALMSFIIPKEDKKIEEKKYKFEFTLSSLQKKFDGLNYLHNRIRQSNLPANEVAFLQDSVIVEILTDFNTQLKPQIEAEMKSKEKPTIPKDSTQKKTN